MEPSNSSPLTSRRRQTASDCQTFVIRKRRTDAPDEWLLVQTKGETRAVEDSARAATQDLLAYWAAFSEALKSTREPDGLGVAWGAQLEPKPGRGIMLCTPDMLELAMSHLYGGTQSGGVPAWQVP